MSCCLNGTMSAMLQMVFIPITPPLAATSMCIGCARNVQLDSCTSTECVLSIALESKLQGVHTVRASKLVSAIPCKLITHHQRTVVKQSFACETAFAAMHCLTGVCDTADDSSPYLLFKSFNINCEAKQ